MMIVSISRKDRIMEVQTTIGSVEGVNKEGCCVYYGIPFAKPPVGEFMFRHPLPPDPWEGVLKADRGSANPVQVQDGYGQGNTSLDCLYLNIFVPDKITAPAPVMVWIYGGAFYQGGAGTGEKESVNLLYDMTLFAKETGCIVVTLNYRLNVYGFLNLHCEDKRFDRNNGLYDQIMALRFVKENIAAFGGNPDNITLFGQSAGGSSILALMTMKDAEGLFQKTIVQSPCVDHFFSEEESKRYTHKFLRFAGVRTPSELLKLPEESILKAVKKYYKWVLRTGELRCAFSPTIDGVTIPGEPKKEVTKAQIPMMIGTVSEECNLFVHKIPVAALPFAGLYLHISPQKTNRSYKQRYSDALTEKVFVRPVEELVKEYSGPIWQYFYDYAPPECEYGCCHISELPVLFGSNSFFGRVDDAESERVGSMLRKTWADFARYGNPGWPERTGNLLR